MSALRSFVVLLVIGTVATTARQAIADSTGPVVPFVGCPSDGQMGAVKPPPGNPAPVHSLAPEIAKQLAYYKGEHGPGTFAPAGWHCRTWYGSNGSFIIVTPDAPPHTFPAKAVAGPGVELVIRDGGTSGRFDVAAVAARFFPDLMHDFIQRVKGENLLQTGPFDPKPYPHDEIVQITPRMLEFSTPANQDGFGTEGFLKSDQRVKGLVALSEPLKEPTLSVLRVRLPATQSALSASLIELAAGRITEGSR
jgi:hypothetical protein